MLLLRPGWKAGFLRLGGFGRLCLGVVIPNFLPRNSASLAYGPEAGFVGWGGAPLYG